MKKITLLFALLITSIGFSQDLLLGFESGESGGLNGGPFGNADALQVNLVAGTGSNTTQVAEFIANSAGEVWQGININLTKNVDLSDTQTMTIDVKSSKAITFLVKVNGGLSGAPEAAAEVTHNGDNTWQTLSFTFNSAKDNKAAAANGKYASFVIHAYWAAGVAIFDNVTKDERTFYVDNIKGKSSAPVVQFVPTVAPSPTNSDTTILSIYNDTGAFAGKSATWTQDYAFGTNGGDVDTDATESGVNNALKMDFSVAGWGAGTNSPVDITGNTHIHFDYYAPAGAAGANGHEFKFIVIGEGQGEKDFTFKESGADAVIEFDKWVSVDIPLTHYTALGLTLDKFLQYKLGSTSDLNTKVVFFDNIYIYNSATANVDNNKLLGFSMYPNPANNSLNISANGNIEKAEIFNVLGKKVQSFNLNSSKETLDISNLSTGIYLVKYVVDNKVGTAKFIKQ
ncbi:MAG: T9SS type A sorting domain-containing protein [Polaribacter sp.]